MTPSPKALEAFRSAENSMGSPNPAGLNEAISKYTEAVELEPGYALAHAKLAQAYVLDYFNTGSKETCDRAQTSTAAALKHDGDLLEGKLAQAVIWHYTGKESDAERLFDEVVSAQPAHPQAKIWQAQLYVRMNRLGDAETALRSLTIDDKNNWLAWNELGFLLDLKGDYHEAEKAFRMAAKANPNSALAASNLASALIQTGSKSQAEKILNDCWEKHWRYDYVAILISLVLRLKGDCEKAIAFAREATNISPSRDDVWRELGDCLQACDRTPDSKTAYENALKVVKNHLLLDPSDGRASLMLAFYEAKLDHKPEARQRITAKECTELNDQQSQLYKARIWELLEERQKALEIIQTCFRTKAVPIEFEAFPDMGGIKGDDRYRKLLAGKPDELAPSDDSTGGEMATSQVGSSNK